MPKSDILSGGGKEAVTQPCQVGLVGRGKLSKEGRGVGPRLRTAQAKAWVCTGPWRFGWNRRAKRGVIGDGSGKALVFSLLRLSRNG